MYNISNYKCCIFNVQNMVTDETSFIDPTKIALRDIKSRQNRSQTVNIVKNLSCRCLKNLVLILKELESL